MKKYDLTQGGILRKLLLVAVPIMGTQLMQMAYNLTDMFWLGKLSTEAVAASGSAGMFMWLSMAFLYIGRMGSEIGVSQNLGRNDAESAKGFSHNALFLAVCLGLAYGAMAFFFSDGLISLFNIQEAEVAADAAAYLSIVGIGFPMSFISAAIVGSFNGAGNSRFCFFANAAGLVINMILDPILIFTFGQGIFGAAAASVIAQTVVMIILLIAVKRHKDRPFAEYKFFIKPSLVKIKQILRWSLPIACESLLFTALAMITTRFVTPFGADALATQKVGSQVESLSWLIGGGFGSAITAFTGQNFGAGKWRRIRQGFRLSVISMLIYGVAISLVLFFGGKFLFSIFIQGDELLAMGDSFLKILSICQIAACLEAVSAGIFRGSGRSLPPSLTSISANIIRVPIAYFMSRTALGLDGVWWGITIGGLLRGISIFVWLVADFRKQPHVDAETLAQPEPD